MLYNLFFPLASDMRLFNLFKYLTFRTGGAMLTSMIICFCIGPFVIRWLKSKQKGGQPIRSDGPETHQKKKRHADDGRAHGDLLGAGLDDFVG